MMYDVLRKERLLVTLIVSLYFCNRICSCSTSRPPIHVEEIPDGLVEDENVSNAASNMFSTAVLKTWFRNLLNPSELDHPLPIDDDSDASRDFCNYIDTSKVMMYSKSGMCKIGRMQTLVWCCNPIADLSQFLVDPIILFVIMIV